MIKHIVFWRFKKEAEGRTKDENMALVRERLLALRPIIPEIRAMELGVDVLHSEMSYDMALVMEFDSLQALQAYKEHPAHRAVSAYVSKVREGRVAVDYGF